MIQFSRMIDFLLIWLNVQNETMLRIGGLGGTSCLGAVMVVDYATAAVQLLSR